MELERTSNHVIDDRNRIAILEVKTLDNGTAITPSNQVTIARYQYSNHLGSASLELNETAEIISYQEYHPFGSTSYELHTNDSEVSLKRYQYVGKERDGESGLYYYGARYYADWLCRFVSVDPLKDDYPMWSSFIYAGNMPVTMTDVNGMGPGETEDQPFTTYLAPSGSTITLPSEAEPIFGGSDVTGVSELHLTGFTLNGITYSAQFSEDGKYFTGYFGKISTWFGVEYLHQYEQSSAATEFRKQQLASGNDNVNIPNQDNPILGKLLPIVTSIVVEETVRKSLWRLVAARVITASAFSAPLMLSGDTRSKGYTAEGAVQGNISAEKLDDEQYEYFYRAMSWGEYLSTGGYLVDENKSGEGPHVTANLAYLMNPNGFVMKKPEEYGLVVRYKLLREHGSAKFSQTPFKFNTLIDSKGGPIFEAARNSNMWYQKTEGKKGISYGFPGNSTINFNFFLIGKPEIIWER